MQKPHPDAILNTALPPSFRRIQLELAREAGHPEGASDIAYVVVAPLNDDGHIDAAVWKQHREACRVARMRPNQDNELGHLVHRPGGSWAFHYDTGGDTPEEVGHHFDSQRFAAGEYVSINEKGKAHTFRVVSVQRL
ncbi:MAG: hypothetical protein P4M07_01415 [Xanthobacteraceae bacterium]|nr:hypothetical protein [Xanthobacteraceae bacterium]